MNIREELALNAKRMKIEAEQAYKNINKKNLKKQKPTVKKVRRRKRTRYIYCLLLEDKHFYIGQTTNVQARFLLHSNGKGSNWTKLHKPIKILEYDTYDNVTESECVDLEDKKTQEYADIYGTDMVRGGRRCSTLSFYKTT